LPVYRNNKCSTHGVVLLTNLVLEHLQDLLKGAGVHRVLGFRYIPLCALEMERRHMLQHRDTIQ